jgi:arylsulfatase A-like enzyme
MPTRPNILFILTDQQSSTALSCAGNPWLHTPAMDAIAYAGTRVLNAYCPSPVCVPARAAMVTGQMPHQLAVNTNSDRLHPDHPTMGTLFTAAGYHCAYAGHWHLVKPPAHPGTWGFDFLPISPPKIMESHLGSVTDAPVVDAAISYLASRAQSPHTPFALTVSLLNPHDICYDIKNLHFTARPESAGPALPQNFPRDPLEPEFITQCRQRTYYGAEGLKTQNWSLDLWRGYLHHYHRLTEQVDLQIARLMHSLKSLNLEQNTLVVFTSDHGEGMAAHQWVVKLMLYQEPVTVPLLFKLPGQIPANAAAPQLASTIDILPTLCDYAGIPIPPHITGKSLKPVFDNPSLPGQPYVVAELSPDTKNPDMRARMLRTKTHKYIAFSQGARPELLFNLASDPGELTNLAHHESAKPILDHHRQLLTQHLIQTHDTFTGPASIPPAPISNPPSKA